MLRLLAALVTVLVGLPPATGTELILTGISASGGSVRAFFSAAGGASVFSLNLHEDYAGIRLERVNRRAQQVWIVESGEGRWIGLGDPKSAPSPSLANPTAPWISSGTGALGSDLRGSRLANDLNAPASVSEADAGSGLAHSTEVAPSGADGVTTAAPHRWQPGVVREPTAAEVYRTQYGAAALETAIRNGQIRRE